VQPYEGVDQPGIQLLRQHLVVLVHRTEDDVGPVRGVAPDDPPRRTDPTVALAQEGRDQPHQTDGQPEGPPQRPPHETALIPVQNRPPDLLHGPSHPADPESAAPLPGDPPQRRAVRVQDVVDGGASAQARAQGLLRDDPGYGRLVLGEEVEGAERAIPVRCGAVGVSGEPDDRVHLLRSASADDRRRRHPVVQLVGHTPPAHALPLPVSRYVKG
jgi:hypothetical protein